MSSTNSVVHHPFGMDPCDHQNHPIFNATTQKRNAVDPRTGLFEAYVPLPSIVGGDGEGPVVDMSLFYSPLVNNHAGLGDGWSFAFTCYREEQQQLTLHSGEVLRVEKGKDLENLEKNGVAVMWDLKGTRVRVRYPDDRREWLEQVGSSKVWMPTSIGSHTGDVNLTWQQQTLEPSVKKKYAALLRGVEKTALEASYIRLAQISADSRTLVKLTYTDTKVTLAYWPDEASEHVSFTLSLADYALTRVDAPDGSACEFKYHDHAQCGRLLKELTTFEGVKEAVAYKDNGLTFKDNPKLSALPCVSQHTLTPRGGMSQPIVTAYAYQRDNDSDGQYSTTTTQGGGACKTVYRYDKTHERVKETTSEGACEITKEYSNQAGPNSFKAVTKVSYSTTSGGCRIINDESYFYSGRLVKKITPGAMHHFQVENDFSHLKAVFRKKGVELESSDVEVKNDYHTGPYDSFDDIIHGGIKVEFMGVTPDPINFAWGKFNFKFERLYEHKTSQIWSSTVAVMSFSDGQVAKVRELRRYDKQNRLEQISHHYKDADGRWVLISSKDFEVWVDELERCAETSNEGSETTSILSGRLITQTDVHDNQTTYTYDEHGRLKTLTRCAQSDTYQQVTTYSYPSAGRLEIIEPDGTQRATEDDGLGNLIAEYVRADANKPWRQTLKVDYDNRGRKSKTTRYDYLADGTQVSEWCELKYDNWNQECQQTYSTGQHVFNQYDPVAHTRTEWSGRATDKQRKVTTYNDDDTVANIVWTDAQGEECQLETLTYTHAAQVHTRTIEGAGSWRCTTYTYDAAGRLLKQAHDERASADAKEKTTYAYSYEYPANWLMTEPTKISLDGQALGERAFDSLGRVTRLSRGDISETYKYAGMNSVPESRTGADGVTLAFEYFPELGNEVKSVSGKSADDKQLGKQTFTYAHGSSSQATASEGGQVITFDHQRNQWTKQQAKLSAKASTTVSRSVSEGGRLLSETDAAGNKSVFSYNGKGQRDKVVVNGDTTTLHTTQHTYDERGRLENDTITLGGDKVTVTYAYDTGGQETQRRFTLDKAFDLSIKREYSGEGRLKSIELYDEQAKKTLGSHAYSYTVGGAVETCSSTGVWQPKTPKGTAISMQAFTYDNLGNVKTCISTFDKQSCTSTYTYDSAKGYRLQKVEHSHADYKPAVTIVYDAAGRVIKDAAGKTYAYDWLGRLVQSGSRHYTYDPLNRLASSADKEGATPHQLIHEGYRVRGEYPVGEHKDQRIVLPGSSACQVQKNKAGTSERTLFNLCDDDGSVLLSFDVVSRKPVHHAYSAYGAHSSDEQGALHGYNGEYREAEGDQYPLGSGYRWYAPQLMQFQAQDGASPFGQGGPNAYGYCDGDPVNHSDPSGQWKRRRQYWDYTDCEPAPMSLGKHGALISAIIFGGITVLSAVMTGGVSLMVTAALVTLAVVSAATAIAGAIVAESDPEASRILGWVSLAAGIAGGLAQMGRKITVLMVQLGRSGRQAARHLIQKGAGALRSLRQGPGRLPKTVVKPAPGALRNIVKESLGELRIGELDRFRPNMRNDYTGALRAIVKEDTPLRLAFKALGVGEVNTVMYGVTGVLGLTEAYEDGVIQTTNSWKNNFTALPWGDFGALFRK
ncbi:hypothetical protein LOY44_14215 [Pseudomonas sp. B21-044]|uniref:RHS repeat domain-containing protein n=1 Tax=Pseudomonas sp. B21-044 TaxID=2895488 RepID=UPI00216021A9|nr:RHS repeat-associated core domain-containing protein [Pseudomonas sp. B21-044]UVL17186.1 hypothetical protein LOY44_14215 [Pseudomonas sp. B21-044]